MEPAAFQNGQWYNYYAVSVALLDSSGNPASFGPAVTTEASFASSNPQIGTVDLTANFNSYTSQLYAKATFYSYSTQGTTTITASVPGIAASASATITTGLFTPTTTNVFNTLSGSFFSNTVIVVGDGASTREALGSSLISSGFSQAGFNMPTPTTDKLITSTQSSSSNLVVIGYNNTLTTTKDAAFGIKIITTNPGYFFVNATAENVHYNFTKSTYATGHSFAIVDLKKDGSRSTMVIWGYGWLGAYVGTLFMSNPSNWASAALSGKHLLILTWTDLNSDHMVEANEITVYATA